MVVDHRAFLSFLLLPFYSSHSLDLERGGVLIFRNNLSDFPQSPHVVVKLLAHTHVADSEPLPTDS